MYEKQEVVQGHIFKNCASYLIQCSWTDHLSR